MDYEKKYKEAMGMAEEIIRYYKEHNRGDETSIEDLEQIFPELKEFEDEKIRKRLLTDFSILGKEEWGGLKVKDICTWLEKQGEQKVSVVDFNAKDWYVSKVDGKIRNIYYSVDKVEPNFKIGEWVVSKYMHLVMQILNNDNGYYKTIETDGTERNDSYDFIERNFKFWSIQDAKDGDVLVNGSNIFIFHFINDTRLMGYCHVNIDDGRFYDDIGKNECFCLIDAVVNPATKEQRDLLFSKMKDAGYRWDDEKKELKKVGQKLTELAKGEDYGIDGLYAAVDILQKTLGEVDGYQTDDGILEHKCAISAVKKLYEQNPTWSEEDDYNLQCMIAKVTSDIQKGNVGRNNELIDWLKSLKERVQPKPKEWSEEDKRVCQETIDWFEKKCFPYALEEENPARESIKWLKSLKNRM